MDASVILSHAKKALGDRAWTVDCVLHVGADLAQFVNSLKNLSGKDKSELVCQTILKMLDDGEMAEKERGVESTGKVMTKVPWGDCRNVVKNLLPVSLELLVKASRGEISLPKEVEKAISFLKWVWIQLPRIQLPRLCLPQLRCCTHSSSAAKDASASKDASATPKNRRASLLQPLEKVVISPSTDHLSEVRELVSRVEKMLKEAQALPEVKASLMLREAEAEEKASLNLPLQPNPLPPTLELNDVSLPGELPIHAEVSSAQ